MCVIPFPMPYLFHSVRLVWWRTYSLKLTLILFCFTMGSSCTQHPRWTFSDSGGGASVSVSVHGDNSWWWWVRGCGRRCWGIRWLGCIPLVLRLDLRIGNRGVATIRSALPNQAHCFESTETKVSWGWYTLHPLYGPIRPIPQMSRVI